MKVRTRIAPSPTGHPHVGTLYMGLFNLIFAKANNGSFILRIEDTDQKRSRPEYEESIYESLRWIGLEWDEGPDIGGDYGSYKQSERSAIYTKYCDQLLKEGKAYKCFTTSEELDEMRIIAKKTGKKIGYDRRHRNLTPDEIKAFEDEGRSFVIRLKVPLTGEVVFKDEIKGIIKVPCADIDDQVLMKSDGLPTYHLANVIDDHLMEISHVIRGDEWVSSTPKHILINEAFGFKPPVYIHMPLLLGTDGKKLSKRKNPTSAYFYRDSGYLPEAFLNFLSLMGYSMEGDKEIYSLDEIIKTFNPERIGTSGAVFDVKKLDWINQQYMISSIEEKDLWGRIKDWGFNDEFMTKLMPLVHTRMKTFGDFIDLCGFFFVNHLHLNAEMLCPRKITPIQSCFILQTFLWNLEKNGWDKEAVEVSCKNLAEVFQAHFKKEIIPILFVTFTGKLTGPPLFDSIALLGEHRARARILEAIKLLGGISNKKMPLLQKAYDAQNGKELFANT
ncbi:MAG: Glutamate--tRNA ligase [Chlamydiia bacterium]|nr:Glutamate--tRNA ligase [Chlamydiia bacterium]